ncbi:carbon-nitrogen hydrolase family protein [Holdemania massiliensis]|uniref:Carbon-nitrogen hydrolase family protein n=1 Tax=Holdemania massiliensis TaxID=1468449 RepID=A0A6N7S9C1_9FIRM|nr:carbon-nitrogen hydrolase family protein [Holdemania massiliensis]MSA72123.1 carbon-nitrogen hydrolase family protein [Holdemania massiliensis]MSA90399.1 carbon-nitrogen hydrolase family protein [Holdemania massiliensis]MSB79205.1 carbon-nitrogen hydrolase family protein [Holdemania massiliensis]MSC34129.1 carbon-nitrogen hydrolase family protein [Holdemania massiliensis]MSC40519.1 carbon-nitrogen hydrolase family protein [Holdemania massiliensis]
MDKLKIALLQLTPTGSLQGNLEKGLDACRKAKKMGADLALFPEMWSNGYAIYDRPGSEWMAEAIPTDSDFICQFGKLAQELEMAIGITLLETYETGPRNTLILFDRLGHRILTFAKFHTCDFDVESHLTRGEDFYVEELDTACGKVKVGAMICFDREFPESARILMLKGAEVILTPNACPMEINRLSQLRARAYENMLCVATCNYPDTVPDCNGNSTVFDGIAYLPGLEGSRDTCILQADEKEGIYLAELDLKQLREYRRSEVHGNAYRRPQKYGLLVDEHIDEPFVRANHRAE